MKRIYSFLTSMPFMAFLFIVLAISMAVATFIESSKGIPAARALVYNAFWFELLWGLLTLNLINNLFKYSFFKRRKFAVGLFHVSFIIIIIGALITRYLSFEGTMHIRENLNSSAIVTTDDYFYAGIGGEAKEKKVRFSEFTPSRFSAKFENGGTPVKVKAVGYIVNAEKRPLPSENGIPVIDFVYAAMGGGGMQSSIFEKGTTLEFPGFSAGFESSGENTVEFFRNGNKLFMTSPIQIAETSMMSQETTGFSPGDTIEVKFKVLYGIGNNRFLIRNYFPGAVFTAVKGEDQTNQDAVMVEITDGGLKQTVAVFGRSGATPDTVSIPISKGELKLAYGALVHPIPFSLFLRDFQLDRYPGSQSPSSYASEITLIDSNSGLKKDVRIFMNNTLTYKGYKFFQSSYDTDEMGTILSVNHDFWGTLIT
jgi:hypothetical protein